VRLASGLTREARQTDVPDATALRGALVTARGEAAISDGEARRVVVEERDVAIGRAPQHALRLALLADCVE
jgi:hypothetical protein